ncbi:hypothetical protein R1sor_003812 [Riccia sorocarpa]|uniref:RING-type E3 ubiquitin transferase n=1 Tax=Riccia sorocarpa TaxID=122646 RepID=A0ABD3H649_9MARC
MRIRRQGEGKKTGEDMHSVHSVSTQARNLPNRDPRLGDRRAIRISSPELGNRFFSTIRCHQRKAFIVAVLAWLGLLCVLLERTAAVRPLKEKGLGVEHSSFLDQWLVSEGSGGIGPYPMLNISGTYKGTWYVRNNTGRFSDFQETSGNLIFELTSSPTDIRGVHYVQGEVVIQDGNYRSDGDLQMKMEGVYVWPFRQLRMVLSTNVDRDRKFGNDFAQASPYHLVFQDSPRDRFRRNDRSGSMAELRRHCKIQMVTQVSAVVSDYKSGKREPQVCEMQGFMEGPMVDDDGECFSPLAVNATSVNVEVYYNKAVNYTLMVTFISFLQVLFLIRQMEHSNTQSGTAKVSLLMIGQQAIMDAYLCLLHLTAGILLESLFNAFATAAFFKFVIFSIFEMRYLLAIWKARRPVNSGEGWEAMRRELSVLYSRFYGFLLGGILIMYELHSLLRYVLILFYSFWIPQIVANVVRDLRKPLHPYYILGMTVTRLAIPLYTFGCPHNFMRVETSFTWCISLVGLMLFQAGVLLLQHYMGARCFIPRQLLPEKYCYHRGVDRSTLASGGETEALVIDCVICMASVDTGSRSTEYMVTPCDHIFHSGCLQRWMDIKMECPTCRRALPPV